MIWLTWRQARLQAIVMAAGLALLATVLAVTGPGLAHEYATGLTACRAGGDCSTFTDVFFHDHTVPYYGLLAVVLFIPAVIGLFWGAPLVAHELEAGTHRLVWNQGVTRTRWLAVKLSLIGLSAMAAAGLGSLVVGRWARPLDASGQDRMPRLSPLLFDARGITPIGYAAFAFVLGVTVGILIRRALPAMAVTLAVFVVVQIAMPLVVRPHLIAPVRQESAITAATTVQFMAPDDGALSEVQVGVEDPGAWVLSNRTVDRAGHAVAGVPFPVSSGVCSGGTAGPPAACFAEIARRGYRQVVLYQPASRYWAFQAIETAIFLVLAAALAGVCFWRIRRVA